MKLTKTTLSMAIAAAMLSLTGCGDNPPNKHPHEMTQATPAEKQLADASEVTEQTMNHAESQKSDDSAKQEEQKKDDSAKSDEQKSNDDADDNDDNDDDDASSQQNQDSDQDSEQESDD